MSLIDELQSTVGEIATHGAASVVRIGRGPGRGAGVVVAEAQVLTNAHNLRGLEVTVTFADGRSVIATVAATDPDGDLALLTLDTAGAAPLAWAGSDAAIGQVVFALTTPPDGVRVTVGTITSTGRAFRGPGGRRIPGGLEHSAPLARGSSGGPILNAAGELLGINTHRIGEGFYLAIPADAALRQRVESLGRGESKRRVHLGVALAPSEAARRLRAAVGLEARDGLLVRGVESPSRAEAAGLRPGDLIVEVSGSPVRTPDDLFVALDGLASDGSLVLRIVRGAEELEIVVSGAAPSE